MADLSLLVVSLRGWGWLDVIMLVTMMMSRAHYQFYYCIPRPCVQHCKLFWMQLATVA